MKAKNNSGLVRASLFPREQRSLFGEILDWMLIPLLVIWPMGVVLTFLVAQNIANRPFDRALEQDAQRLVQLLQMQSDPSASTLTSQTVRELLHADDADQVYYQIRQWRQGKLHLLSGENTLPLPPGPGHDTEGAIHIRDDLALNQNLRIASTWVDLAGAPLEPVLIQVGETLNKRKLLATEILKGVSIPQFFLLPLALALVWVALNRSVRPLSVLEQTIRARKPDDLSPLEDDTVPQEVAPLVGSVNDLLKRLAHSVTMQKRFLADAAHQLKTPLAGLRMQADLAQRESNQPEDLKKSLSNIALASMRATHTVNQLLSLARAEGGQAVQKHTSVHLPALAQDVMQDVLGLALEKAISLGYESSSEEHCYILGNPILLKEMLRNLLDNAINYTPPKGDVILRIFADPFGKVVVVQVEDNGPGVSLTEREAIFRPFYRSLNNQADGSGLGLAIVQEIVQQHRASLSLEVPYPQNSARPGVCFSLRFNTA